jgi:hypothetical protein
MVNFRQERKNKNPMNTIIFPNLSLEALSIGTEEAA